MDTKIKMIKAAFPSQLSDDINTICDLYPEFYTSNIHEDSSEREKCFIQGETVHLLSRVYAEPLPSEALSVSQQCILNCYFCCHCNGYVREEHLKRIIHQPYEWVIPYVMRELGSYVKNIIDLIYLKRHELNPNTYKDFLKNNPSYFTLTKARVLSYWNEYHRRTVSQTNYSGFKMIDFLENLMQN
jgi:hypothetical protein